MTLINCVASPRNVFPHNSHVPPKRHADILLCTYQEGDSLGLGVLHADAQLANLFQQVPGRLVSSGGLTGLAPLSWLLIGGTVGSMCEKGQKARLALLPGIVTQGRCGLRLLQLLATLLTRPFHHLKSNHTYTHTRFPCQYCCTRTSVIPLWGQPGGWRRCLNILPFLICFLFRSHVAMAHPTMLKLKN